MQFRLIICVAAVVWVLLGGINTIARADEGAALMATIGSAKPGAVVRIPAGHFSAGDIDVPAGVSVVGAGYSKTIIDATGKTNGFVLRGATASRVSDLTVLNAEQCGVLADGASAPTVERVEVRGCGTGLIARGVNGGTFANLVLAGNGAGAGLVRCSDTALVNATIANSTGTALQINQASHVSVFNNLLTFAATGIGVTGDNHKLLIDHNMYICNSVGRAAGDVTRKKVESWAAMTGFDAHSLTMDVQYEDPAAGNFRPVSKLDWAPIRATTSGWGTSDLGGFLAPAADIDGASRKQSVDLGAYQESFPEPRLPDGHITIQSGVGVASAGLFTNSGQCVHYLFQNLPLAKGSYPFWLPSHDWQGRALAPGNYVVKVTESHLSLDYIAAAGNGDVAMSEQYPGSPAQRVSLDLSAIAFDSAGRIVVVQSGAESGEHVRAYDRAMTHFLWSVAGGGDCNGIAIDDKGRALVMRKPASLIRLDTASGDYAKFSTGSIERSYDDTLPEVDGMCWLAGKLYVADAKDGKLFLFSGDDLDPAGSVAVPNVSQPAADPVSGLIWAISGNDIVAVDPSGAVKFRKTSADKPRLLAAAAGKLAVWSDETRKVAIYDTAGPGLTPLRTIGTGDDGFGPIVADRFWSPKSISLDEAGDVAVADPPRTCLFPAAGVPKMHMGMWGQAISYGWFAGDDRARFININGGYDILLDAKSRSWAPGMHWRYTMNDLGSPLFCYTSGGKNFALFNPNVKGEGEYLVVVRMETDGTGRVLERFGMAPDGLFVQQDATGTGVIDATDAKMPVLDADGKRITDNLISSLFSTDTRRDGSLAILRGKGLLYVPMTGLDTRGIPQYDFAHRSFTAVTADGQPTYTSPFDLTTLSPITLSGDLYDEDNKGFVSQVFTDKGPNGGEGSTGTSMARFDSAGRMRWFSPLTPIGLNKGLNGVTVVGGIVVAARGNLAELETMDADGLGTGVLGPPAAMGWMGMWLDNPRQMQGFTGNDGKPYIVIGDYADQAYHWMQLAGTDQILHHSVGVTLSPMLAQSLAGLPAQVVAAWPVPPPPHIVIKRLPGPMAIDGDLAKWRSLGIQPILISESDPSRNSALVRLGWASDGLYVQVIKFANILTLHQTEPGRHYQQDGIEFNVDTFWSGWKYNVTRLRGKGDIILRDRFIGSSTLLDPAIAPRSITVLDSAADVPERKLFEATTGADMSNCKVMEIEFKLTKEALAGLPHNDLATLASGDSFELGIAINHNPLLGSNLFEPISWPADYGAFSRDGDFATAVLE